MPVVAWLIGALGTLFATRLGTWIVSAMVFMGIAWTSNKVVLQPTINQLKGLVQTNMGGGDLGSAAIAWGGVLKLDVAVGMIISAYVTRQGIAATKMFLAKRST